MTITPYTTPLQYEYKPLNLIAFAEPLSKMQEQFDLVKASIDESDFDITNLPYGTDPERAKELLKIVEGKRDELAQSLAETKNYKQAASKLKRLNTLWQEDPEVNALKANYDKYVADVQLAKDNVKSGYWNQTYADQWLNRAVREYEGAGFTADETKPEGTYTTFGRNPRVKDIQKDFDELAWKVAAAVPGESREGALQEIGIDYSLWDKKFLQEIVEEKDAGVVAERVSAYLKTLPQYKEFFLEKADYDFADLQANPTLYENTAKELNDEYITAIDAEIATIKKAAKKNPSLLLTPDYLDLLTERETAVNAKTTGEYSPTAVKNMYEQKYLADAYDMTALGKVFAYKNVKRNYTWRDLPEPDTSGGGGTGTEADLFGEGFFTEAGEVKMDFNTLNDVALKNHNLLNPIVTNIGKLASGAVSRITVGSSDSELYKKTKYRQSLIWDNQEKLLKAITENTAAGGNAKQLIARIQAQGLTCSEGDAKRLISTFGKGEAIGDYQSLLESGRAYRNAAASAIISRDQSVKNSTSNSEFSNALNILGQTGVGSEVRGIGTGDLNVGGITFDHDKLTGKLTKNAPLMSYDALAKGKGYKNLADAVAKGELFEEDAILHGQILKLFASTSASKSAVVTKYEYVGNPKVDATVGALFTSTDDLLRLDPVDYTDWSKVPGFREGDKDVKLNLGGNAKARLGKVGQEVVLITPITFKDSEGNTYETDVTVKPPPGFNLESLRLFNAIDVVSDTDDPADIQINETAKSAKFNILNGETALADNIIQGTTVLQGGTPVTMFSTTFGDGVQIVVDKTFTTGTAYPKLKVGLVESSTGKKTYINDESGKEWSINANSVGAGEAAKVLIMKMLE